jgi:hypothetical protein
VSLAIRIDGPVRSVHAVYAEQALGHRAAEGYVTVTVSRIDVHELVVFDLGLDVELAPSEVFELGLGRGGLP